LCVALLLTSAGPRAQNDIPRLTQPVNDFAGVVDPESKQTLDSLIRSLQQASGDVVVVATVPTFEPYGDIRDYAVRMFENQGQGIGQKGRDNGLLVLVAVKDRRVQVEVGYDLEQFVTDGFAGETSRQYMVPAFRQGQYGRGLVAGVSRIVERVARGRNVALEGVAPPPEGAISNRDRSGTGGGALLALFVLFILLNLVAAGTRGRRRRRGWHSGVGPFGGGFGGGFGGFGGGFGGGGGGFRGGFGGGFGGFGGGRSGGGGGGAGW
jgi:uncharacterized protein